MERNKSLLLSGICLTAALTAIPAALMRPMLAGFDFLLGAGLVCGFFFSFVFWQGKEPRLSNTLSFLACLPVAGWMVYSVSVSSFGYKEIILILLKGVLLLTAVLSFFISSFSSLASLQYLSLTVFMGQSLFFPPAPVRWVAAVAYLLVWGAVIKLQLIARSDGRDGKGYAAPVSIVLLVVFFSVAAIAARYALQRTSFVKLKYEGVLLEEDKRDDLGRAEEAYYNQLDTLQRKVLDRVPEMTDKQDRQKAMFFMATLGKESADAMATTTAEEGLTSLFKNRGAGNKASDPDDPTITIDARATTGKKQVFLQQKAKRDFISNLKNSSTPFTKQFGMLNTFNRMSGRDSREDISRDERELHDKIEKSSLPGKQKKTLNDAAQSFNDWKMFELYKEKLDGAAESIRREGASAEQFPGGVPGEASGNRDPALDLLRKIESAGGLPGIKEADGSVQRFRQAAREQAAELAELKRLDAEIKNLGRERGDQARQLQELLALKVDMLVRQLARGLEEKVTGDAELRQDQRTQLLGAITGLRLGTEPREIEVAANAVSGNINREDREQHRLANQLTAAKIFQQEMAARAMIRETLEDRAERHEQVRAFLKKMEQAGPEELVPLEAEAEELKNNGFIDSNERQASISGLRKLVALMSIEREEGAQPEPPAEKNEPADALAALPLDERARQFFEELLKSLDSARTSREIADLETAARREFAARNETSPSGKARLKEFRDMVQAALDKKKALIKAKEFSALLEKIAELERIDPIMAGRLEAAVEHMPEGAQARSEYMVKLKEMLESAREGSKDTLEALEEKIEALRADLVEIERQIRDLERRLLESGSEREAIIAEINANLSRRGELEKQLAELARQRGEMERRLDEAREKKLDLNRELEDALARAQKLSSLSGGDSRKKEQKAAGRMPGPQVQITILPHQMVMAVGRSVVLKAVAVFDNLYIKEITADSEWFTDNPAVAAVDSQGNLRGCGRGVTTVGLRYKNAVVKKIDVAVGEPGSGHMQELGEITR